MGAKLRMLRPVNKPELIGSHDYGKIMAHMIRNWLT